jgi:hypothetical protein
VRLDLSDYPDTFVSVDIAISDEMASLCEYVTAIPDPEDYEPETEALATDEKLGPIGSSACFKGRSTRRIRSGKPKSARASESSRRGSEVG